VLNKKENNFSFSFFYFLFLTISQTTIVSYIASFDQNKKLENHQRFSLFFYFKPN